MRLRSVSLSFFQLVCTANCTAMLILLREEKGMYHTVSSRVSDSQLGQVEEGGAEVCAGGTAFKVFPPLGLGR